jgi:biopolymer transport protein ExbB/TolQ
MAATITVVCPYCKYKMRASAEHVGRKGSCARCQKLIDIKPSVEEQSLLSIQPVRAAQAAQESQIHLSPTNVPGWQAGILGLVATALIYLAIFTLAKGTYLGNLFLERGPMQHATTLVTCWGLAMLALKYRAVREQTSYAEQELELMPLEIGMQITPSNVDRFLEHLEQQSRSHPLSILGRRILGALEYFKARTSVPEVQQYLATQAELDSSAVDAGYTLLRAFIWVIPLLGFIGTVTGISSAVLGLDSSLKTSSGGGAEQLMSGLGLVTAGLATAFDTTFLALVMAIVLLFPTESLRKTEYALLDRIQAFANESLLRRLSDEQGPIPVEKLPEVVRDSLTGAFREHQKWLEQWQTEVSKLGEVISGDFEAAVRRVHEAAAQSESSRIEQYQKLSQLLEEAVRMAQQSTAGFAEFQKSAASRSQELAGAVSDLQGAVAENSRRWREILQQQGELWNKVAQGSLGGTLNDLTGQIGKLLDKIAAGEPIEAGGPTRLDGLIEPAPLGADLAIGQGLAPMRESPKSNLLTRLFGRR